MLLPSCALVLLIVSGGAYAALPLPKYIKPCGTKDPGFEECMVDRAMNTIPRIINGDRKYNIPPIDPLKVSEIRVDNSGPQQAGIAITLRNCDFSGASASDVKQIKIDFQKKKLNLHVLIPRLTIIGQYEIKGRVLLLPITGKGDVNVTIVGADIDYVSDWVLEKRDGDEFFILKNSRIARADINRAYFDLENLFNGDKLLGPEMNRVLNDNWKDAFKELSPPVIEALSEIISRIVNNISGAVPYSVAFPDHI